MTTAYGHRGQSALLRGRRLGRSTQTQFLTQFFGLFTASEMRARAQAHSAGLATINQKISITAKNAGQPSANQICM